eukprot:1825020-Pleurochrysis_carterae.AAC.5
MPLPLLNSVTGLNHAPAARKAARLRAAAQATASELPGLEEVDEDIVVGRLYFIEISMFEGELRVEVGRPERDGNDEGTVLVSWLQRRGWSDNPAHPGFLWSGSPSFDAAAGASGRGVMQSSEP